MTVVFAAMYSYVGPKTLAAMTREWGVEYAAEPGSEVDPGLLQFKRLPPDTKLDPPTPGMSRANEYRPFLKRGLSSRIIYDDEFGDPKPPVSSSLSRGVTVERASATFVRALMGAVYLHGGRPAAKSFFKEHFMSRQLSMSDLFSFSQPTRDLSKLCAREGFERPIAKIISETGRLSRHPVFVVGIFSGKDKLGEGAGGSLDEARFRAAAAALKGWYLYSPLGVRVPSSMEDKDAKPWKPILVDPGEIIV
jgi:dsRNA-specific ribonuclease